MKKVRKILNIWVEQFAFQKKKSIWRKKAIQQRDEIKESMLPEPTTATTKVNSL